MLTPAFSFKMYLTFVDGLKQKSCTNSENLLELMICLKKKTYYTLMNKSIYIYCHVCDLFSCKL